MIYLRSFIFSFFVFFTVSSYASEGYVETLITEKEKIIKALSMVKNGAIHTEETKKNQQTFFDKYLFSYANSTSEMAELEAELKNTGRKFLEFLESTSVEYYSLSFEQWLVAANVLMSIDDLLGKDLGWGNLVIKADVCNKLFFWMFDYFENNVEDINQEKLAKLIDMQVKLRSHFPSRESMTKLALEHYNYLNYNDVDSFVLQLPVSVEGEVLEKSLVEYFGSKENATEAIGNMILLENNTSVSGFVDLYDNPMLWMAAQNGSGYLYFSWTLYLHSIIMQEKNISFNQSGDITNADLLVILEQLYKSQDKFWMTRAVIDSSEKPEIYVSRYLASINEMRGLNAIRIHRNHGRSGKVTHAKSFSFTKLN